MSAATAPVQCCVRERTHMLKLFEIMANKLGGRTVQIAKETIEGLPEHFDAIVSSDDNHLSHGGGIARALWQAAGADFVTEVTSHKPPLRLGDVYPTRAGRLRSEWILHVITIDFDANRTIDAA
jgi:O-acetyl-ADP-ribose deacetylase (regulator of RNase III)